MTVSDNFHLLPDKTTSYPKKQIMSEYAQTFSFWPLPTLNIWQLPTMSVWQLNPHIFIPILGMCDELALNKC